MLKNNHLKPKKILNQQSLDSVDQELINNFINHVHKRLNEIFEINGEFT